MSEPTPATAPATAASEGTGGALAAVEALLAAVVDRRVADVVAAYDAGPATYVFPEGPRWSTRGGERVEAGWRAWLGTPNAIFGSAWVEGPYAQQAGELAWVAGVLDLDTDTATGLRPLRMRASYVLRRTEGSAGGPAEGAWRIVHEHFSRPDPDPYGRGDWLAG